MGGWGHAPQLLHSLLFKPHIEIESEQELPKRRRALAALQLVTLQQGVQHVCASFEVSSQPSHLAGVSCICITAAIIPLHGHTLGRRDWDGSTAAGSLLSNGSPAQSRIAAGKAERAPPASE